MKQIRKISLLLLLTFLLNIGFAKDIVIYHTSDVHGHYYSEYAGWDEENYDRKIGGYAALKSLIDTEEKPFLLLDSGDFTRGSIEDKESKGKYAVLFMNKLKYDASIIGNHEFDYGYDNFKKNLNLAKFDMLAANIFEDGKYLKKIKPYKIYNVDGIKIAVIGIGKMYENFDNVSKISESKALQNVLKEVEMKKPNATIVLIHNSVKYESDSPTTNIDIARTAPGKVDLYLGGHYHAEIQNQLDKKSGAVFVESGSYLRNVSKIILDFDDNTHQLKKLGSTLIPLWVDKYGEDEKILKFGDKFRDKQADTVIGNSENPIIKYNKETVEKGFVDSDLVNFVSDIMREYAGTDLVVQNTGGVRSDLGKGKITYRDIYNLSPFDNTMTYMNVSGKFLKDLFKYSLGKNDSLYAISGATMEYSYDNREVKNLKIFVKGKLVQDEDMFTLATNDFVAGGKAEGKPFKNIKDKIFTNISIRNLIIEYIKNNQPIKTSGVGRIKRID